MKKLLSLILIIAACVSMLTACNLINSAEGLWTMALIKMGSLSSYRQDSSIDASFSSSYGKISLDESDYLIISGTSKNPYYYSYSEFSTAIDNETVQYSKSLTAYSNGKMYVYEDSDYASSHLSSEMSASDFKRYINSYSSGGFNYAIDDFSDVGFTNESYGYLLYLYDASDELVNDFINFFGIGGLVSNVDDLTITARIDKSYRILDIEMNLVWKNNTSNYFTAKTSYSEFGSPTTRAIYDEDYTEVDDVSIVRLLSMRQSDVINAESAEFTVNMSDEVVNLSTSEKSTYTENDSASFEYTDKGFVYDVILRTDSGTYNISYKRGTQTVTSGINSQSASQSESEAIAFVESLISAIGFDSAWVQDVELLDTGAYRFTCDSKTAEPYEYWLEELEDTHVSHSEYITVEFDDDGEIKSVERVVTVTGTKYKRTVKATLTFTSIER